MASFTLPRDFFFGAAASGPQTEGAYKAGGRIASVWDLWSDERLTDFHNCVGSYMGNDFYHRYEDDLRLLKSLGLDSYRTSIQWTRLRGGARDRHRGLRQPLPLRHARPPLPAWRLGVP